jgi:hypothetical protein
VDDDLGLFALLPDSRQADIHIGIRVPYLSSSVKGLRGFVRLSVLSPRMFLALPYPYCRQRPAYYHFVDEYAEGNVDTLHKKNLFFLGEDRS